MRAKPCFSLKAALGMSLVELMVAALIGLIGSVVIFQVFAVFEGQKRTTTSGGDAQTNGALALFTVERDLRMAGYGINNLDFLGCTIRGWDEQTGGGTAFTLTLVPVVIKPSGAAAPTDPPADPLADPDSDMIAVTYGTGELLPNPASITQNMPSPSSDFKVNNRYGFKEGDLVIAAEPGKDCTLAQVSTLPGTPGQTDNVIHNSGNYTDPNSGAQVATRYNKPAGLGVSYGTNGKLFNLGALPSSNVYSVRSGQLMLQQRLSAASTAATPIYDGIVKMRAQYGKDTSVPADGIVDVFDDVTPTTAAGWAQVLAVRIAIVARSSQYEKGEVAPPAITLWEASAAAPVTAGETWALTADERHYRYKVFQTVVPIRNMIWKP